MSEREKKMQKTLQMIKRRKAECGFEFLRDLVQMEDIDVAVKRHKKCLASGEIP